MLVVAHEGLRKHPRRLLASRHTLQNLARQLIQVHAMPVGVLYELTRNGPEVGLRIDVLPAHLQELSSSLRRDEPEPEPRTDVWILCLAGIPQTTDLVVRKHTVA